MGREADDSGGRTHRGDGEFRIVFLVYDSRSGSTFVASELNDHVAHLEVTPELRFDHLFRKSAGKKRLPKNDLLKWLYSRNGMRNLGVKQEDLEKELASEGTSNFTVASFVQLVLRLHLETNRRERSDVVMVKAGPNAFVWKKILQEMPQASFVYVVRDPRAVVNSKFKTTRPYYPVESLAWAGAVLAAYRWLTYSRTVRAIEKAGAPVLTISYEDALEDLDGTIRQCAGFLGLPYLKVGTNGSTYQIPEAERGIHRLVEKKEAVRSRAEGWRNELTPLRAAIIESVVQNEMLRRGYVPQRTRSCVRRAVIIASQVPGTVIKMVRHMLVLAKVIT